MKKEIKVQVTLQSFAISAIRWVYRDGLNLVVKHKGLLIPVVFVNGQYIEKVCGLND